MNIFKKQSFILKSFIIFNFLFLELKAEEKVSESKEYNLATDIADNYIKSFTIKKEDEDIGPVESDLKAHQTKKVELDDATKRKVCLSKLLGGSSQHYLLQKNMEKILNSYAWDDLKLYYGTTSDPGYHLISKINRTITQLGEGVLATMIATPSSNIDFIKERQKIIKTFISKSEETDKLKESLKKYKDSEQSIFSFWTKREPLYSKEYNDYMNRKFYYKNKQSNKSANSLEFSKRFYRDWWDILSGPLFPLEFYLLGIGITSITNPKGVEVVIKEGWKALVPGYNIYYGYSMYEKMSEGAKDYKGPPAIVMMLPGIFWTSMWIWTTYSSCQRYNEYSEVLKNLALRLADLQAFLKSAQEVSDIISRSPELEKIYGSRIQKLRELLAIDKKDPKSELGRLVLYLKTMPLTSWSYFFNNAGKLLASYKLFIEHKNKFRDAFYDYGRLDAFISFSTLIKEAEKYDKNNKYVYAKFLSRKEKSKPYIKIKGMWNNFLDSKIAVPNDLEMDASPGGVRNIILTGPNAGGKSTFVTGITNALLLAHIAGIAPAKEIIVTPFNKINTYIEVVDDIAAGKSLFMAEVDRAQSHINILKKLKKDEFSFTIFDEPFSGTNPLEGGAAEYSILESIGGYSNALNIVATHYPIVMLLEKNARNKGFVNYKVFIKPTIKEGNKKKINYTYKVLKGRSNQAIAIDILEAEGYDTKMLKRARDIILNPDKYKSAF